MTSDVARLLLWIIAGLVLAYVAWNWPDLLDLLDMIGVA